MAATASFEPDPEESAASNWFPLELPDASLAIRLNPDLVDRLEREVIDSFKSLSKRGSEVGGILLGQVASDPRTVFVEDYEVVPCAYMRGPLYLLSDVEKRRLEVAVRHRNNRDSHLTPVGFLRSNTRTHLAPDDEDVSIVSSYFNAPDSVLLLIKPFSMKPCLAGFFAWGNGQFHQAPDSVQFPFRRSELLSKRGPAPALRRVETVVPLPVVVREEIPPSAPVVALESPAPPPPAPVAASPVEPPMPPPVTAVVAEVREPVVAPAPPPSPVPEVSEQVSAKAPAAEPMPEPQAISRATPDPVEEAIPAPVADAPARSTRVRRGSELLRWVELLAGLLLLFFAGAYLQHKLEGQHPDWKADTPAGSSLSLKVERSAGQLYLSWDRNALPILSAQKAALVITDGEQPVVVPLTLEELRTGSFVYSPTSSDTSFRVDLSGFADGHSVSESIRAVWGRPSALGSPAPPAPLPVPAEVKPVNPPPVVSSPEPAATARTEPAAPPQPSAKEEAQPPQPEPAAESPTP